MYSLRYGTIPIVRATGGLADTICEYKSGKGNGFLFEKYEPTAMLAAIKRAIKLYKNREEWVQLVRAAMNYDFSWEVSSKKYVDLYRSLIKKEKA